MAESLPEVMMLSPKELAKLDPDSGFLCYWLYWRPDLSKPNPQIPGVKQSVLAFIPREPDESCLCGSGEKFCECCRPKPYWQMICPNPGLDGYSLMAPQSATFHTQEGKALREHLSADGRLRCVAEAPESGFWIYQGAPAVETELGAVCFGDVELKIDGVFVIKARSEQRKLALLALIRELAAGLLGEPEHLYAPVQVIDKRTRKLLTRPA